MALGLALRDSVAAGVGGGCLKGGGGTTTADGGPGRAMVSPSLKRIQSAVQGYRVRTVSGRARLGREQKSFM